MPVKPPTTSTSRTTAVICGLLIAVLLSGFSASNRIREANQAYLDGQYRLAEQLYREILDDSPDNSLILFNLGSALIRQQKISEAEIVYRRFLESQPPEHDRAAKEYNMGYLFGESGENDAALKHLRKSLYLHPEDTDAKFNLELLLRRQLQKEEENQQQDNGTGQPPPFSPADFQPRDDPSGNESHSASLDAAQLREEDLSGQPEISQDQLRHAEDIMQALEHIEKALIKDFKQRQMDPVDPHEKDW